MQQFGFFETDQERYSRPARAVFGAALAIAVSLMAHPFAKGQETTPFTPGQTANQSANEASGAGTTNRSANSDDNSEDDTANSQLLGRATTGAFGGMTLSAEQIISILQENPDLVVDLKSLMSQRALEQGIEIDANDISDESLYSQIESNASLRSSVTIFLRARGYLSGADQENPGLGVTGNVTANANSLAAQSNRLSGGLVEDAIGTVAGAGAIGTAAGADTRQLAMGENNPDAAGAQAGMYPPARQRKPEARANEETHASTDVPKVLRRPAPYNLQSMRDLYTQIPDRAANLKRFGSDVFVNREDFAAMRGVAGRDTPLDVPLGPDYVLGPGDTLTVQMWGGVTQNIVRVIDRDGRVLLPESGSLAVAGLPLDHAQDLIESALKRQFRDAQVAVTVSHLRSVRVYVVGDVQRPGGYDISSLATPVSALYAAGGPTSVGSLRTLRHFRGSKLVEEVDLYDFLLHGIRNGSARFESGDTLLVPPAGPQVAVSGAVKRPAIYELNSSETTLGSVVEDAGGFTAAASLGHITVERIDPNRQRETITLNVPNVPDPPGDPEPVDVLQAAINVFRVHDGDRIRIEPILPYSERAIYVEGHVVRPGRMPYIDGMRLNDVLRSYRDMLPEPAAHGEIVRLVAPDLHAQTIDFDVPDVLIGNANVTLEPFDTIRIFGRYELDAPKVTIRGEVQRPGTYSMSKGMTAAQLVRMAGGFKRDALLESADLSSYKVTNGNQIIEHVTSVRIGAAVDGDDPDADTPLKPGDILAIHQITGWTDIGESITIEGQVKYPGSYGFRDGERLSSVLRRAGGLLPAAYPAGAVLVREQVRELEQKSREELIRQIETNAATARLSPGVGSGDASGTLQLIKAQQEEVLANLKSHPPNGRMVIHITANIDSWANTPADIELRRGDVLTIPKVPGFVLVTGQVYNATALTFAPGKTASWYLSRAGGTNSSANRKEIFVIRANGSVIGRRSGGLWDENVLSVKLNPGDVVVVPQKIIGNSLLWRNLLSTAQIASSIAITASVAAL